MASIPLLPSPQGPIVPPPALAESRPAYPNSPDGLRMQLQNILAAAKEQNRPKLESLVNEMQIPNFEAWFTTTFGQEKGESWAEPYSRDLVANQKNFEDLFMQIAGDEGEIYTRKVNDNPGPPGGIEAGIIKGLHGPIDFFFASWKRQGSPQNSKDNPIGYFVFLDGRFRWESTIYVININSLPGPAKVAPPETPSAQTTPDPNRPSGNGNNASLFQAGVGGVTYPACSYCPDPEYTKEARAKHFEGIVVLQAIIQPNGRATDIKVVKSPDPGLTEKAIESVSKWRFKPARDKDKKPVPVIMPIEVTFRLLN